MIARILPLSLVILLSGCAPEPNPPDVAYRQFTMSAVVAHLRAIGMLVGGQVERTGDLPRHADALAALANSASEIFPEGSIGGTTEALPEIWQQPDEFQDALDMFQESTAVFAAVASTEQVDDIKAAFDDVRGACRNCHDQFRE